MDPYEALANAVILLAVKDWRLSASTLKRKPEHFEALQRKNECERFFRSLWFGRLTRLDGKMLLAELGKEMQNRGRKRISAASVSA
ncbi:MAG: hypothetical protein IJ631_04165 [Schwartzia sp.]|nr:hypothetical protein [Schwartzia sp. (in: firmicutes)]